MNEIVFIVFIIIQQSKSSEFFVNENGTNPCKFVLPDLTYECKTCSIVKPNNIIIYLYNTSFDYSNEILENKKSPHCIMVNDYHENYFTKIKNRVKHLGTQDYLIINEKIFNNKTYRIAFKVEDYEITNLKYKIENREIILGGFQSNLNCFNIDKLYELNDENYEFFDNCTAVKRNACNKIEIKNDSFPYETIKYEAGNKTCKEFKIYFLELIDCQCYPNYNNTYKINEKLIIKKNYNLSVLYIKNIINEKDSYPCKESFCITCSIVKTSKIVIYNSSDDNYSNLHCIQVLNNTNVTYFFIRIYEITKTFVSSNYQIAFKENFKNNTYEIKFSIFNGTIKVLAYNKGQNKLNNFQSNLTCFNIDKLYELNENDYEFFDNCTAVKKNACNKIEIKNDSFPYEIIQYKSKKNSCNEFKVYFHHLIDCRCDFNDNKYFGNTSLSSKKHVIKLETTQMPKKNYSENKIINKTVIENGTIFEYKNFFFHNMVILVVTLILLLVLLIKYFSIINTKKA